MRMEQDMTGKRHVRAGDAVGDTLPVADCFCLTAWCAHGRLSKGSRRIGDW